jgi:type IV pilus assembly protein PilV
LLEVLISIVVIGFGLLGIAGLQAIALKNNMSASVRMTASTLAADMVDRIRSNYLGLANGDYNKPNVADYGTAVAGCGTVSGCTPSELARTDLNEWSQRVARTLPNGTAIVCVDSTPNDGASAATPECDNAGTNLYVVKIWWIDDRTVTGNPSAPQRFSWTFNP